jgi:hypothetical protein
MLGYDRRNGESKIRAEEKNRENFNGERKRANGLKRKIR